MKSLVLLLISLFSAAASAAPGYSVVLLKDKALPITEFNLTFRVGSADDPAGQEGLASLTAEMLREGGVKAWQGLPARSREALEDFLFPYAADIDVNASKEQISFTVSASAGDAVAIFSVLSQLLLAPAFDSTEFDRLKMENLDYLKQQLPREDQEELGKAALDRVIFGPKHPYSHPIVGTVHGVQNITLEKIREFYAKFFTQPRLTVGAAGVVTPSLEKKLRAVFSELPAGGSREAIVPAPPKPQGHQLTLVKGEFDATGVHLGHPLSFNRNSPEFPEMALAMQAFGKHRSFLGRLMREVREIRGLNYGTYAYVEDFPRGGMYMSQPTQVARQHQAFTLWARPTPIDNGCFLLRQVLREVDSLSKNGLTEEEFSLAKSHMIGATPLLATALSRRLGFAIDSRFYGIQGDYLQRLQKAAEKATRDSVNGELRKNIDPDNLQIVVVTRDPDEFKDQILKSKCEIHYGKGVTMPKAVLDADAKIAAFSAGLTPERIHVVDAATYFEE